MIDRGTIKQEARQVDKAARTKTKRLRLLQVHEIDETDETDRKVLDNISEEVRDRKRA